MADKLPKKQPKRGRGGTRDRGPKGGTKPKCNTKMRKGAQEDQRKPQKERPKVGPRANKKKNPKGREGKGKGRWPAKNQKGGSPK